MAVVGSRDPLVGTVINAKFRVERAIARGGMGRIYYGTQAPLDRPVALKIVKADSVNEEESQFLKRFLLEASILAKLQHPNVVTLFDYGRIEGVPVEMYFIAMEYLNGQTLTARLRARSTLSASETIVLVRQIARGLREAHARGVVHRDLKPSNIVLVPAADGEIVKIVDFGIGKIERSGEDLTRDGVLVGTPKYMAPEQFDGASSPASDVYALGTIAYQMLAGSTPFAGGSMADIMIAKLQRPMAPIRQVNSTCDATERLESLVYRMLARRPDERITLDGVFAELSLCEEEIFGARAPAPSWVSPPVLTITPRPSPTAGSLSTSTVVALLLVLGSLAAVGLLLVGARFMPSDEIASPPPAASKDPESFVLHLDSAPRGAAVTEGGQSVGTTPVDVKIDRASVATGPRTFQLKKDGHAPATLVQGLTDSAMVETLVPLVPDEIRPAAKPTTTHVTKPVLKPAATGDHDIRLTR